MSDRGYLSIGEVLQLLQDEFPDVTISKIRFLESQGLIDPERTPSGYRKFYELDIDRLKFILREQKDSYLPLKVIKNRLDAGEGTGPVIRPVLQTDGAANGVSERPSGAFTAAEPMSGSAGALTTVDEAARRPAASSIATPAGRTGAAPAPAEAKPERVVPEPAPEPEEAEAAPGSSLSFDELVGSSGLTAAQLSEVERYGLVVGKTVGRTAYYDDEALVIARLVAGFLRFGIEPRHVRMYRNSAEREAGVFEQVIMPYVKQRNPQARAQALATLSELTQLGAGLRDAMMRQALRSYTDGL